MQSKTRMKTIRVILLAAALVVVGQSNAQGLGDMVKSKLSAAANTLTGSSNASDVVMGLLGTKNVAANSIEGHWTYSTPCLVFSSQNLLASMGSNLITSKVNSGMNAALTKVGLKPGALKLEFGGDGTCVLTLNGKSLNANYAINGSTLTLTLPVTRQSIPMNVNVQSKTLQFAMKVDKLLVLLQNLSSSAQSGMSTLNTVATMLKNYDGMQLGLQFAR